MGAFDPIGSDIDKTLPGHPHVVDSDGWGWFMILLIISIPFLCLGWMILTFSDFFIKNVILCSVVYIVISFLLGITLYRKTYRHRGLGTLATVVTMLPLLLVTVFYSVPFVVLKPDVNSLFDFVILLLLFVGGAFFTLKISLLFQNGAAHLIISFISLLIGSFILFLCVQTEDTLSQMGHILEVYM